MWKKIELLFMWWWFWIKLDLNRVKCIIWNGCLLLWWNRFWIRKDEFHKSLDMDGRAMAGMSEKRRKKYTEDLMWRREIAHERDLAKAD